MAATHHKQNQMEEHMPHKAANTPIQDTRRYENSTAAQGSQAGIPLHLKYQAHMEHGPRIDVWIRCKEMATRGAYAP